MKYVLMAILIKYYHTCELSASRSVTAFAVQDGKKGTKYRGLHYSPIWV